MPLIIDIKVIPGSQQQRWVLDVSGALKCYLKSPPEQGKANRELIKLLAQTLDIRQAEVTILTGTTSRAKKIKIATDITRQDFLNLLGLESQKSYL
jgi:uncharacterized protein